MTIKSIDLVWIVVKDIKAAIQFYTEVVGLKLEEFCEEYKWAELIGHAGGARLGIAEQSSDEPILPGSNSVLTLSVANIETSLQDLKHKGLQFKGEMMEIPGQVKLQMAVDKDGNHFQIVECLKS